jgi:hypothetical protein
MNTEDPSGKVRLNDGLGGDEHPDTVRLKTLAAMMERIWGRGNEAGYVFPNLPPMVSDREECKLDDLRWAIDERWGNYPMPHDA